MNRVSLLGNSKKAFDARLEMKNKDIREITEKCDNSWNKTWEMRDKLREKVT